MLTKIILKDYTTFINETVFDFKATNYKILEDTNVGENRVLKGALFVGENASGKTQVLEAIKLLLDLFFTNSEQDFISKKSFYTNGTKFSLSYFFDVKGYEIRYDVKFSNNFIISEKLFKNDDVVIERAKEFGTVYLRDENQDIDKIDLQLSLIKQEYYNTRFENDSILNEWFNYLKNSMYINCLDKKICSFNVGMIKQQSIREFLKEKHLSKLNDFLHKLNYMSEIAIAKEMHNSDSSVVIRNDDDYVGFKKVGTNIVVPLELESAGNASLFNLILPILFATENDCMLIIDEFSSGLHNDLEEALIKYFYNNSKNSQLFFCSHSTNILDNYLLRPDQIYSFKFDSKKGTLIKRFSDENPRESQNLEKMYLGGVFDGMPHYDK